MQFTTILQLVIHSLSMHQLLNGQFADFPAILDSFYWYSQCHKYSYQGGRVVSICGEHEVADKCYINTETGQMVSIGAIFSSTYQLNPWPVLSASHVVICSWLSASPGYMEPFKDYMSTCVRLTSLRTIHTTTAWTTVSINTCMNC